MKPRWPLLALAIGAFGIGTTEFAPMGLLPVIADGVGVSIPKAGLLTRKRNRQPNPKRAPHERASFESHGPAGTSRGWPVALRTRHQGRIKQHILLARQKGFVAYVGEGSNRLPAVHVSDAVRLYRLALERGRPGARYHAVSEEGVPLRGIAEVIGAGLKLPVRSIKPGEASGYFGWLANLGQIDLAASSTLTRQQLGWNPAGPDILADLRGTNYSIV